VNVIRIQPRDNLFHARIHHRSGLASRENLPGQLRSDQTPLRRRAVRENRFEMVATSQDIAASTKQNRGIALDADRPDHRVRCASAGVWCRRRC